MVKRSRLAVVIAASFALGLSCVGPYAHAGLLGGDDSESPTVEGMALPLGGDVVGGLLGGGLLGGDLLGGVLGGDLLGGVLGGGVLGGDLVGGVLGGGVLGGDLVGGVLGGVTDDLVGGVVGGVLAGDGDFLAAEGTVDTLGVLPDLGAIVPGGGSLLEILEAFSGSGSIVPGLQVLDEIGILGALGSF